MRLHITVLVSAVALSACSQDAATASTPCGALQPVIDSRDDAVPFETVRKGKFKLGDMELDDKFTTDIKPGDEACTTSVMEGFFGDPTNIYIFNCPIFLAGTLDNEANEAAARAAFEKTEALLTTCLGEAFTAETTEESMDYDVYRKTTWDYVDPPEVAEGSFTVDPVYLELSYSPFMRGRGGPSGWVVELQLQEQRVAN